MLTQWTCTAWTRAAVWMLLIVLSGCASRSDAPERVVVVDSVPVGTIEEPEPALPEPEDYEPAAAPSIAVVLSRDTAAFVAVADALGKTLTQQWVRYEINGQNRDEVLSRVLAGGHSAAIAIGQQALDLLSDTRLPVTYCQTLDPSAAQPGRRGVAPLPTFTAQLDAWRLHQPELVRIGMITGTGHDNAAEALATAAAERSIEVRHVVAHSDREMLHRFQRMVPEIQGFILYPDARIQSPRALRELIVYAQKHGVWVLTYNRSIFELGATLLVSSDPQEIAAQVAAAQKAPGSVRMPLHRAVVERRLDSPAVADATP